MEEFDNEGFIKLHRRLLKNPICEKPHYLAVWVYILLSANHKENYAIINNKKMLIEAGSFVGSLQKISKHFGISIKTVKYIVDYFCSDGMLHTERTNKFTIFKVLQWEKFQVCTLGKHKGNTEETQRKTNKNDKKFKNEKNKDKDMGDTDGFPFGELFADHLKNSEEFRAAWSEWVNYRREIKKSPVTELAAQKHAKLFVGLSVDQAIQSMDESIASSWTGLFAPRNNKQSPVSPMSPSAPASKSTGWTDDIWPKLKVHIESEGLISREELDEWFENAQARTNGTRLIVGVDSQWRRKYIEENFADSLLSAACAVMGGVIDLESVEIHLIGKLAEAAGFG